MAKPCYSSSQSASTSFNTYGQRTFEPATTKLQSTRQTALLSDNNEIIKSRLRKLLAIQKDGDSLNNIMQADIMDDTFPTAAIKTQDVMYTITNLQRGGKAYANLTGRFPYHSACGNEYILVVYHYDSYAILAMALKNRQATIITAAWRELSSQFVQGGHNQSPTVLTMKHLLT